MKTAEDGKYKNDAAVNLKIIRELEGENLHIADSQSLDDCAVKNLFGGAAVVLDALLGTGTTGAPRGEAGRLIKLSAGCENILALDIPSGIDPESGLCYEPCVRARRDCDFPRSEEGNGVFARA